VIGESAAGTWSPCSAPRAVTRPLTWGKTSVYPANVACVVNLFGVSDFTLPMPAVETNVAALLGGPAPERPELARSASPINYGARERASMLVVHGTADRLVPYLQSEVLVEAMEKVGAPFYFHTSLGAATIRILASLTTPRRAILMRAGEVSACLKSSGRAVNLCLLPVITYGRSEKSSLKEAARLPLRPRPLRLVLDGLTVTLQ